MQVSIGLRRRLALLACGAALASLSLAGSVAVSADAPPASAPMPGYATPLLLLTAQYPVRDDIGPDAIVTDPGGAVPDDTTAPDDMTPPDNSAP
jgi:hypothetical protein